MKDSKIEWTDHTFNPWIGCTKVSPGCANCYAEARDQRFAGGAHWGPGAPRQLTSPANWKHPLKWDNTAVCNECGAHSKIAAVAGNLGKCPICHKDAMRRPRVFCASLADWLDDEVPIEWLIALFGLIRSTSNLDWLLLTKRPEQFRERMEKAGGPAAWPGRGRFLVDWVLNSNPPENVWIGTTVEDQERADQRIPALLNIPAKVRFLSCEPLLGPVDLKLDRWKCNSYGVPVGPVLNKAGEFEWSKDGKPMIHWIIAGGESGTAARPMHPEWAFSMRDQCEAAGVPFLFKQWGEWITPANTNWGKLKHSEMTHIRSDGSRWDVPPTEWDADCLTCVKVGTKAAGRILAGEDHKGFPNAEATESQPGADAATKKDSEAHGN